MGIMAATVAPQAITVVTSDGNTMTVTSESYRRLSYHQHNGWSYRG